MVMTIFNGARSILTVMAALALMGASQAYAAGGGHVDIKRQAWSFGGFTGQYDNVQLRRGFQVYQEVCSSCHGLSRVRFRNLVETGGPEFPEDSIKTLAKDWPYLITDGPNDKGEMFERAPLLSDPMQGPHKNDNAARAANDGALPPDLSLIAKARNTENHAPWYTHIFLMLRDVLTGYQEGGPDYLYALLTGYKDAPEGVTLADGMNYNSAFPGHQIAMGQPLFDDDFVEYQDNAGATASLDQNARDVSAFLAWAADPSLSQRKQIGWQVMLYLLITTVLLFLGKNRIWGRIKH